MPLTQLNEFAIQENRAIYAAMVGKDVMCPHTGTSVKGRVRAFIEDEHSFVLDIVHEPVNWGGVYFTRSQCFARKMDNWGSLNNVKLVA